MTTDPKPVTCRQNADSSTRSEDMSAASTGVGEKELAEWMAYCQARNGVNPPSELWLTFMLRLIAALREARSDKEHALDLLAEQAVRIAEIREPFEDMVCDEVPTWETAFDGCLKILAEDWPRQSKELVEVKAKLAEIRAVVAAYRNHELDVSQLESRLHEVIGD